MIVHSDIVNQDFDIDIGDIIYSEVSQREWEVKGFVTTSHPETGRRYADGAVKLWVIDPNSSSHVIHPTYISYIIKKAKKELI